MRRLVIASFALLLVVPSAFAQDTWEIWLYDGLQIQIVTPEGISRTVPLPSGALGITFTAGTSNNYYRYVRISPNHRYLVFADSHLPQDATPATASLEIADLVEGSCCYAIPTPIAGYSDTIIIGPFSPDGRQVAALIALVYGSYDRGYRIDSRVVTVDLETRQITAQLSPLETPSLGDVGVFFREWYVDGIKLTTTCLACDGSIEGFYVNWNPATGEVTPDEGYYHIGGDTLLPTNEQIRPAQHPDYPIDTEPALLGWNNVIEYFSTGNPDDAQLIYHDPNDLKLGAVNWVIDGEAYLMYPNVIFRDGTIQTVENLGDVRFVVGTPDGWLMQRTDSYSYCLYYYQYGVGSIELHELGCPPRTVAVLDAPILDGGGTAITPIIGVAKP